MVCPLAGLPSRATAAHTKRREGCRAPPLLPTLLPLPPFGRPSTRSVAPSPMARSLSALSACAATPDHHRYCSCPGALGRDMKPANILLTTGGAVKITDFGSSKGDTLSDTFVGTTRSALTSSRVRLLLRAPSRPKRTEPGDRCQAEFFPQAVIAAGITRQRQRACDCDCDCVTA
jgi:serine/threonine protein kinase